VEVCKSPFPEFHVGTLGGLFRKLGSRKKPVEISRLHVSDICFKNLLFPRTNSGTYEVRIAYLEDCPILHIPFLLEEIFLFPFLLFSRSVAVSSLTLLLWIPNSGSGG
jgi:hypothetical protein